MVVVDCVARNVVPRSSADRSCGVRSCHARIALALRGNLLLLPYILSYSLCTADSDTVSLN